MLTRKVFEVYTVFKSPKNNLPTMGIGFFHGYVIVTLDLTLTMTFKVIWRSSNIIFLTWRMYRVENFISRRVLDLKINWSLNGHCQCLMQRNNLIGNVDKVRMECINDLLYLCLSSNLIQIMTLKVIWKPRQLLTREMNAAYIIQRLNLKGYRQD